MSNTVSLCIIVKNEISNIENLIDTVCPILEQVVVVDTGSTDGTLEKIKILEEKYSSLESHTYKWDDHFSQARNYSFGFAKKEWLFWLDGDDLIDGVKLRKFKENFLDNPLVDAWMLDYNYARLPSGEPQIMLGRERFIRKSKNPQWVGAIHETIIIHGMRQKHYHELEVFHNREGKTIESGRNLRILEKEYEKNPGDPRTAYYYGKELFDHVDSRGVEILEKYLTIENSYYDDRTNAHFRIGKHYLSIGNFTKAVQHAESIYHLDQTRMRAEGYWLMGAVEQKLGKYAVAIRWYKWCLDDPPPPPRVLNKEYYTWNPIMRLVECYLELNDVRSAKIYFQKLEKLLPENPTVIDLKLRLSEKMEVKPKGNLVVVEFGNKLRGDSYLEGQDIYINSGLNTISELDGIGWYSGKFDFSMFSKLKPCGFAWVSAPLSIDVCKKHNLNFLCSTEYNKRKVYSYIKEDPSKPSIRFQNGDENFGPYRIRISNLKKSAVKNGFRIREFGEVDFYIGATVKSDELSAVKILDVCEWLDDYYCKGLSNADAVCVCSDELATLFRDKNLHDNVFVLDDHFEYSSGEWL